jgi:DNA-binding transcriptional LysR family regulator
MALDELRAFLALVEQGSYAAAAKSVDFARTTLAKQVESLEANVGAPLLDRVTGGITLTRAGEILAERGKRALSEVNSVLDAARSLKGEAPSVTLEIPVGMPPAFEQALYSTLRKAAPFLRFSVRYTPFQPSPDSDAWIIIHNAPLPEGADFRSRRVASIERRLQASTEYLEANGVPVDLEDLIKHPIIFWAARPEEGTLLPVIGHPAFPVKPVLVTPNAHLTRKIASAGNALAFAPRLSSLLRTLSDEPRLELVLENQVGDQTDFWFSVRKKELSPALEALALSLGRFLATVMGGSSGAESSTAPRPPGSIVPPSSTGRP